MQKIQKAMPLPINGTLLSLVQIRFESRDKVLDKNSKTSELCLLSRKMTTLLLERDASVNFKY